MKFLHLADLHLGYRQYGLKERELDYTKVLQKSLEQDYSGINGIELIIIAGDLFHHKEPNLDTLTKTRDLLNKPNIHVLIVRGNHDDLSLGSEYDYSDLLNVTAVDNVVEFTDYTIRGLHWSGQHTNDKISEILKKDRDRCNNGKYNIFMTHGGVAGVTGSTSEISKETATKLCEVYDYIALGHIHHKYIIDDKIFNPGSPEFTNISDVFAERGIFVVDTESNIKEHIRIPNREVIVLEEKEQLEKYFDRDNGETIIVVNNSHGYDHNDLELNLNAMKVLFKDQILTTSSNVMSIGTDDNIFETTFGRHTELAKRIMDDSIFKEDIMRGTIEEYYDK